MRILILANVPPGTIGGAEVQALHLARCWVRSGHRVIIAGYANRNYISERLTILQTPTIRRNRLFRSTSYLVATSWLLWTQRKNYDLIYCRFLKEQALVAASARLVLRLSQPLVACPAVSGTGSDIDSVARSPLRGMLRWAIERNVNCVNAISQRIYDELEALTLKGPLLSNIPNGVVIPSSISSRDTRGSVSRIIFVGRLTEQKGVDLLIEAASLLKKQERIFKISLIGTGDRRESLEMRRNALGLEKYVEFLGPVAPARISTYLAESDLFVLPSRYEGMPGALLEALASGLPVIVTRCGGSEEIVDDSIGWIVPLGDSHALADAIGTALDLDTKTLRQMGQRAYDKVRKQYDIENVAERYVELFATLIQLNKQAH